MTTCTPQKRGYNVIGVARKGFYSEKSVETLREWSTDPEKLAKRNEAIRNSEHVRETLKRINSSPEHKAQVQRMLEQVHNDPRIQENVRGLAQKNIRDADWMAAHNQRIVERVSTDGEVVETYLSINSIPKPYSKWTVSRICKRELHELHCGFYWRFQD